MKGLRVQVTTAVTQIVPEGSTGIGASGDIGYPTAAIVSNPAGGQTVYLGGPLVTVADGWPLAAGTDIEVDLVGDILYGLTSTTSQTLHILRRGG